jgi:type II secretory pathway component PulF
LVALGALAAGVKVWLSSEAGHRWVEAAVLRLPQVGTMVRSFATARIARLLGILLESRVSILEALRLTRQSIGGRYAALVARTEEAVAHGQPMSEAFSQSDLISPSVCEAIRSGEQSGQVGALLLNIADFLDEENEIVIRSLASIIEPVILILMGVLVAVVAISMFMPLFDLTAIAQRGAP